MPNSTLTLKQNRALDSLISGNSKTEISAKVDTTSVSEFVKALGKALAAIERKEAELGGATGRATGVVEFGAGDVVGYFRRYQHGTIFFRPPSGPCWVHGAILDKYMSLGAEGGLLGYPTTDETGTPGGAGRFNHFERGSIYWSYTSGAHEVHGAIRDKWASLGWEQSHLGFPKSDEFDFTESGRASAFEHGGIYWWPDVGAFDLGDIVLRYKGLYCFGETNELSASDEPYVTIGVVPVPGQASEVVSQTYEDVDAGDARPDNLPLYRGVPTPISIVLVLQEHDEGDRDKYRDQIKQGVDELGKAVAAGCGGLFGPEAAPVCEKGWAVLAEPIADFLNGLVGTGDDLIDKTSWNISTKDIILRARLPRQNFWGIEYQWESPLLSDGEASYKAYFDIVPA